MILTKGFDKKIALLEWYCIHVSQKAFGIEGRSSDSEDKMSVNNLAILKFRALWQSFLALLPL